MNQFILALCGLPASGKSTLADAIQAALNGQVEIVRTDTWRDGSYYKDWRPEKEGPVRQRAVAEVRKLVSQGKSVIHDDTNYYTSMRHELYKIAIEKGCGYATLHVTTPVFVALKWNRERKDSEIPDSVIEGIHERFDLPGRKYLWDDAILEVDMATVHLDSVLSEIVGSLEELAPAKEPRPRLVTFTQYEQLDVETRRIVSEFLEEHPELRGNREVSEIRRGVLRDSTERGAPLKGINETLRGKLEKLLGGNIDR